MIRRYNVEKNYVKNLSFHIKQHDKVGFYNSNAKKEKEPSPEDLRNDLYDETYADIQWKVFERQGR